MPFEKSIKKAVKSSVIFSSFAIKNPLPPLLLAGVVMELEIFEDFLLKLRKEEKEGSDTFIVEKKKKKITEKKLRYKYIL